MISKSVKVRDCMAKKLVTLSPDTEILRAVHTLLTNDVAAAPVVDKGGKLLGILTERDCIRVVLTAGYHSEYGHDVAHYMSRDVDTIEAGDSIVDAAKLFLGHRFHRYPVMDDGRLVGQISRRDVIRALVKLW